MTDLEIRPSNLKRISLCPASAQFVAMLGDKDEQPSDEAQTGTKAHAAVAYGITLLGSHDLPTIVSLLRKTHNLDEWTWHAVKNCLEFADALIHTYSVSRDNVLVEHHLDMSTFHVERGGTADLVLVVPFKQVVICDWKLGYEKQDTADISDQQVAYAYAAADTFKCREARVYIYQGRQPERERASSTKFTAQDLADGRNWIEQTVAKAKKPDAEFKPSHGACIHCPGAATCPALKEYLRMRINEVNETNLELSPEQWGSLASDAKLASAWAKKAESAVKSRLDEGQEVSGWRLKPSGKTRKITDTRSCVRRLLAAGLDDKLYQAMTLSVPKLEDAGTYNLIRDLILSEEKKPSLSAER